MLFHRGDRHPSSLPGTIASLGLLGILLALLFLNVAAPSGPTESDSAAVAFVGSP